MLLILPGFEGLDSVSCLFKNVLWTDRPGHRAICSSATVPRRYKNWLPKVYTHTHNHDRKEVSYSQLALELDFITAQMLNVCMSVISVVWSNRGYVLDLSSWSKAAPTPADGWKNRSSDAEGQKKFQWKQETFYFWNLSTRMGLLVFPWHPSQMAAPCSAHEVPPVYTSAAAGLTWHRKAKGGWWHYKRKTQIWF